MKITEDTQQQHTQNQKKQRESRAAKTRGWLNQREINFHQYPKDACQLLVPALIESWQRSVMYGAMVAGIAVGRGCPTLLRH